MKKLSTILGFLFFVAPFIHVAAQRMETVVQAGHYGEVTAAAYSRDGRLVATGSADKTIKLWRSSDGREIRTYQGSSEAVTYLEFSPDGTGILSLADDGTWTVWETETGKILNQGKPENDRYTSVSYNPNGKLIVAGTRKSHISVIDISTGVRVMELKAKIEDLYMDQGHEYPGSESVAYSADGQYIVAGVSDYTSILFDANTGKEIRKYKRQNASCTSCFVRSKITGDNKFILVAGTDSVQMFDAATGKLLKEYYGQGGDAEQLTLSADGKLLAGIDYGTVYVWDRESGKQIMKTGD